MSQGFWKKVKPPIFVNAPMANVTDAAFRQMFAECGKPDVFWTEFVSAEGLLSRGKEQLLTDLWFTKDEHPIVAQIFGAKPEQFEEVAALIKELGFDGIDINMGCPDKSVEKQGAGAALIKDPKRAKEIIRATKRGSGGLPVSVKTRLGYARTDEFDAWLPHLLGEDLAALTIHLRTRNEMSDVAAHWDLASSVVALRDTYAPETLILGNGDINTLGEARERVTATGMDGIMIGRGIFGNPWFFTGKIPDIRERLIKMAEHAELFEKLYKSDKDKGHGALKDFSVMKKHFKAYVSGFDGARELRVKLMETENASEVRDLVGAYLK